MQFNSYEFTLYFLPLVVILYFLLNRVHFTAGKILILVASCIFYTKFDFSTAVVLGISVLINYAFAKCIEKMEGNQQRVAVTIPIVVNVLLLVYFKYTNFIIHNFNHLSGNEIALKELILPIGISFFTFQQIAYVVSVLRGEIEKVILFDYLLYILYFPKILMGPLMEPVDFLSQINDINRKNMDVDHLLQGIQIFSFGLFKKVILADTFAMGVLWGYLNFDAATAMDWILITLFYTFEIYFDFSGYSDMAVGASLMLNIELPMNFDSPYKAISVRDFWKRWHMSLTQFFTKYIYIPLGGSRKGEGRTYLNTFIVFLISGFWHGANWTFILWGAIYGLFMIFDRVFQKLEEKVVKPIRWILTFGVVNVLWLLFRSDSVAQWVSVLKTILLHENLHFSDGLASMFLIPESTFLSNVLHIGGLIGRVRGFWMLLFVLVSLIICLIPKNNYRNLKKVNTITILIAAFAFAWAVLGLGGESVFVYFNF